MLSPAKEKRSNTWRSWSVYSDKHSLKLIILLTDRNGLTQLLLCFQFTVRHQADSSLQVHLSQKMKNNNPKLVGHVVCMHQTPTT